MFLDGVLKKEDLSPIEAKQFTEIYTYQRGAKAGTSVSKGIMFKEDYRFFRWSQS